MKKDFITLPETGSNYLKHLPTIANGNNDAFYSKNGYKEFRNNIAKNTCV